MRELAPLTDLVEIPSVAPYLIPFGTPPVQEMLKKLMAAGEAALDWMRAMGGMTRTIVSTLGIPDFGGGLSKAPYDILGDTMRGTRGVMLDKFRRRSELIEAMERLVPIAVGWGRRAADATAQSVRLHAPAQRRRRVPLGQGLRGALLAHAQGGHPRPHRRRPRSASSSWRAPSTAAST